MKLERLSTPGIVMAGLVFGLVFLSAGVPVWAHCDTLDGPVVVDARKALEAGDVAGVLKWVSAKDEAEIRESFRKTLAVRGKGADAKELADGYFFETLVRVHRAGEGAPYTGLKPAGVAVDPTIAAADTSIESGRADDLVRRISEDVEKGLRERHERVVEARKHKDESLEAGRHYVAAYVEFVHYAEGVHAVVSASGAHAAAAGGHAGHAGHAAPAGDATHAEHAAEGAVDKEEIHGNVNRHPATESAPVNAHAHEGSGAPTRKK